LRYGLPTCNSGRSSSKHPARSPASSRSRRGRIPFRGKAIRVAERSGLENARRLGRRPESKVIIFAVRRVSIKSYKRSNDHDAERYSASFGDNGNPIFFYGAVHGGR